MSYNVTQTQYIGEGRLTITREARELLLASFEEDLCECNFLDPYNESYCLEKTADQEVLLIKNPWWYGEGSGRGVDDILFKYIIPETKGHAQILFIWEGGDSVTGFEIIDGVAVEREVNFSLGDKID